jgi:2-oxoglutarate dehydrogenase E1 component
MSEGDISKLIRGDKEALAKQAATGGNTKPANPATAPTPAAQPAPAAQNPANPAQNPAPTSPAAQPTPTAANPAAQPTSPANQPSPGTPPPAPEKEEKKQQKKPFSVADGGSGPGFLFGMSGKGDINEGADAGEQAEQSQALLKKIVKKIQSGQPLSNQGAAPTPIQPSK